MLKLLCWLGLHKWERGSRYYCDFHGWVRIPGRCLRCGRKETS